MKTKFFIIVGCFLCLWATPGCGSDASEICQKAIDCCLEYYDWAKSNSGDPKAMAAPTERTCRAYEDVDNASCEAAITTYVATEQSLEESWSSCH